MLRELRRAPSWSGAGRCTRDGPTDNMRQLMGHGGPAGMCQAPGEEEAAPHWGLFGLRNHSGEKKQGVLSGSFYRASPGPQEAAAEPPALILSPVPTSSLARRAVSNPAMPLPRALTLTHGQQNRMLSMMIPSCCALSIPTVFAIPILLPK